MAKIDYADLLKAAGVALKTDEDIDRVSDGFRAADSANLVLKAAATTPGVNYGALLQMLLPTLIAFIQARFKKKDPPPAPPAPPPDDRDAPVVPEEEEVPAPTAARTVRSFRLRHFNVVRNNENVKTQAFKAIIARTDPVIVKDRVVHDCSPIDQFGNEIREWPPELKAKMFFSNNTQRIRWYGHNREISHITMTNEIGCMPIIKVDDLPVDNQDYELGELFALYYTDGQAPDDDEPDFSRPHIKTPTLPSLRARR